MTSNPSLYRLIYCSSTTPGFTYLDLKAIMETSIKNNRRDGLTGILCYADCMFLQILEGSCENVNRTYHRIVNDKRHHTTILLECLPIESRLFGNWSMNLLRLIDLNPDIVKRLILQYSNSTSFQPNLMSPYQCLEFAKKIAKLQHRTQPNSQENPISDKPESSPVLN